MPIALHFVQVTSAMVISNGKISRKMPH